MPKLILLSTLILALIYSFVVAKQYKKLVMKLIYSLLLTSTAIIATIVVYYISNFGDYLMYFVGGNLIIYLVFILLVKKSENNTDILFNLYFKDVVNIILIVLVFSFAWHFIVDVFSSTNYLLQTLYIILFMGIYTIIQLVYRKFIKSNLKPLVYSILVGSIILVGTGSNIIDSFDSSYYYNYGKYKEAYFDTENTILDRKLVLENTEYFELDSQKQVVIIDEYIYYVEQNEENELHRINIAEDLDEIILTSPKTNDNDDLYMDLVYEEYENIMFVTTYDSLYLIDNNELSLLYSRDIDLNAEQYVDYCSALYKEVYGYWYLGEDIIYYETESNRYIFDKETKVLVNDTENWDSSEYIRYIPDDYNLDYKFKLSVDFTEIQILIGEGNYLLTTYSTEEYDNTYSYLDLVDFEMKEREDGHDISSTSYTWIRPIISFQGDEFVKEIIDDKYYYSNTSINKLFDLDESDWLGFNLLKPLEIDDLLYIEYVNRDYSEDSDSYTLFIYYNIYSLSDNSYSTSFIDDNTYYMACIFIVLIPIYNDSNHKEDKEKIE